MKLPTPTCCDQWPAVPLSATPSLHCPRPAPQLSMALGTCHRSCPGTSGVSTVAPLASSCWLGCHVHVLQWPVYLVRSKINNKLFRFKEQWNWRTWILLFWMNQAPENIPSSNDQWLRPSAIIVCTQTLFSVEFFFRFEDKILLELKRKQFTYSVKNSPCLCLV